MEAAAAERTRRIRGLALGAVGIVLLFGPAIALILRPGAYSVVLLVAMGVGIAVLLVAFLGTPRRRGPKLS